MARYAATKTGLMHAVREAIKEAAKEDLDCRDIDVVRVYRIKDTDPAKGLWDVELSGGTIESHAVARKYIQQAQKGNALV